jgi:hypothetical protein
MEHDFAPEFTCRVCGEKHPLPLSYSIKAPLSAKAIPEDELESRVLLNVDQCVIDQREFFLRGRVPIPVHGLEEPFVWGVWAEISPKNFLRSAELWSAQGREAEPVFDGYLNSVIEPYGDTYNLLVEVRTQAVGVRPNFVVKDVEHPLAIEQREGISRERVQEIAEMMWHRK